MEQEDKKISYQELKRRAEDRIQWHHHQLNLPQGRAHKKKNMASFEFGTTATVGAIDTLVWLQVTISLLTDLCFGCVWPICIAYGRHTILSVTCKTHITRLAYRSTYLCQCVKPISRHPLGPVQQCSSMNVMVAFQWLHYLRLLYDQRVHNSPNLVTLGAVFR